VNPSANVLLPADYQLPTHWHSPIAIKVPITRSIVAVAESRKKRSQQGDVALRQRPEIQEARLQTKKAGAYVVGISTRSRKIRHLRVAVASFCSRQRHFLVGFPSVSGDD
jgi:hypothetical protein